jgi:hypothetical protein
LRNRTLAQTKNPAQPALVWLTQLIGTLVIGAAVYLFFRSGSPFSAPSDAWWSHYALGAILLASAPALMYLRKHKARIDADVAAVRANGVPDPARRQALLQSLTMGGVLCDLPQAVGVLYLMTGSEMRWFLGATLITVSLRLSYRPFTRARS